MESPFFRNRRWYQRPDPTRSTSCHPASIRGYGADPIHEPHRSAPKVVRIPVHFVGSGQVDCTGSAVKIQKVFRGFLVRKCLKKVRDIGVQVDEIEEKLWNREIVELVRREEKERLRMNETLMSLLFKLDSICGVDFGVRGCRKAVIRKVIALQEKIDAFAASDPDRAIEIRDFENSNKSDHPIENSGDFAASESDGRATEIGGSENSNKSDHPLEKSGNLDDSGKNVEFEGEAEIIDVGVDCEVKVGGSNGENHDHDLKELDDNKRNRELLERMMEESEKMTTMMRELNERNEMQTKMLNALTNRVEMLEKAFLCDRLRRKKKKARVSATCKEN